jgi:hypothetical protein
MDWVAMVETKAEGKWKLGAKIWQNCPSTIKTGTVLIVEPFLSP